MNWKEKQLKKAQLITLYATLTEGSQKVTLPFNICIDGIGVSSQSSVDVEFKWRWDSEDEANTWLTFSNDADEMDVTPYKDRVENILYMELSQALNARIQEFIKEVDAFEAKTKESLGFW